MPPEVFTTEFKNPVGGSPEAQRNNLREADRLLKEAGYEIKGNRRVDAKTGEALTIDFLAFASSTLGCRASKNYSYFFRRRMWW